jgi:hypothetical protein
VECGDARYSSVGASIERRGEIYGNSRRTTRHLVPRSLHRQGHTQIGCHCSIVAQLDEGAHPLGRQGQSLEEFHLGLPVQHPLGQGDVGTPSSGVIDR